MKNVLFSICLSWALVSSCQQHKEVESEQKDQVPQIEENNFVLPEIPKEMDFAGERIPLTDIDLKERLDKELLINNFWHSQTIRVLKRTRRWLPVIKKIMREEGIPEDLAYISIIESGFNNVTSPAGAKGFWQLLEETGKEFGLTINEQVDERYHVEKSTRAACRFLNKAHKRFDSWTLAAASYNLGMFGVADNLERQGVDNYFDLSLNPETARYVFRILACKLIFESPQKYGFKLSPEDYYPPYRTKDIKIDSTIENLYDLSIDNGITIKILRLLNPWIRGRDFKVKKGEHFIFKLPENNEQLGRFKG